MADEFDMAMMKGSKMPKGKKIADDAEGKAKGKSKAKTVKCPNCGEEIEV